MRKIGTALVLALLLLFTTSCTTEEKYDNSLSASTYENIINIGLEDLGISENELLHIEEIDDEKIVFFTKDDGIGTAIVGLKAEVWYWKRTGALAGFETDSNISYTEAGSIIKTFNGKEYVVFVGEIYNDEVDKMTIYDDTYEVEIREYFDHTYWFIVLDDFEFYKDVKLYNLESEIINN